MALRLRTVAALLEDPRAQGQLPNYPYFQFLKNPVIFLPFMGFRLIHIVQRCVCRQNIHEVFIMKIKGGKTPTSSSPSYSGTLLFQQFLTQRSLTDTPI